MLVRHYQDLAFRTAFVITGDAADAEDAAQNAFVKAYFALPRFREGVPFRPWLLQIVANEARNRRTATRRHPTVDLTAIADQPEPDDGNAPEAIAMEHENRRRLVESLNTLTEEDRTIIVSRYFLELNEAEMASVMNCPRGTVKSRLSRALGRMRVQMVSANSGSEEVDRV